MAAWSGFTDEDLRKMRTVSQEENGDEGHGVASKKGMARRPRGPAPRQKINRPPALSSENNQHVKKNISDEGRLSKENSSRPSVEKGNSNGNQENSHESKAAKVVEQEKVPSPEPVELSKDQAISMERGNVAKFQQQQKVIEEANKQKRALLSKAIEERRKMAKAESQKLVKIQQELTHLDTLLNIDVGIIRDKIEEASLEYAQAQRRYEKLEKEFIESKIDLYEKSENKEKLTEHLYTIINQNEVRKAKKLVELMEQLAMQISPEELELTIPVIPQLTNFTAASTIHEPGYHRRESESTAEDGNCKKKGKEEQESKGEGGGSVGEEKSKEDKAGGNNDNKESSGTDANQSLRNDSAPEECGTSGEQKTVEDNSSEVNHHLQQNPDQPETKNAKDDNTNTNEIVPVQNSSSILPETNCVQNQPSKMDHSNSPASPKAEETTKAKGWGLPFT